MPKRKDQQTRIRTEIARLRVKNGLSQVAVAYGIGLPLSTYRKLERGQQPNPSLRSLVNLSLLYEVPLESLYEPTWLHWYARIAKNRDLWLHDQPTLEELRRMRFNYYGDRIA